MKKTGKVFAIMLCLAILMSSVSFAVNDKPESRMVSQSIIDFFAQQGHVISPTAKMSLIPIEYVQGRSDETENYKIQVIDQKGNSGTIYEALILKEDENGQYVVDNDTTLLTAVGDPIGGQVIGLGDIVITTTGSFFTYLIPGTAYVYQITDLYWSYTKSSPCTVNSAVVKYGVGGTAYNIYTLQFVQYSYGYTINSNVISPVANTTYSNTYSPCPYAVDIAVSSSSGSGGGMYFTCDVNINGTPYHF